MQPYSARTTRATLLGRVRGGDDDSAWREFDQAYREMLLRFCRSRGLQHADAEDVAQLVFARLAAGMGRFEYDRSRGRFRDYLFRCVRSALCDWASGPGRSVGAPLMEADGAEERSELSDALEREWVDHHYRRAIDHLLATADDRTADVLRGTVTGRDVAGLAADLGMREMAVYKAQQRLRDRLRARISEQIAAEDRASVSVG
jgi:RNA polymerase sigma-70 factor (ECF subfamily)